MDDWMQPYQSRGLISGTELLLKWDDAVMFVKDCGIQGWIILGIDFYREISGQIVELPSSSADFSSLSNVSAAVSASGVAALRLISNGFPDKADWASFVLKQSAV